MPAVYAQMSTVFVEQVSPTETISCCLCQPQYHVVGLLNCLAEWRCSQAAGVNSLRLSSSWRCFNFV